MFRFSILLVLCTLLNQSFAQEAIWSKPYARIYALTTDRELEGAPSYYSSIWAPAAQEMSQVLGKPVEKLSPEYLKMKLGHLILGKTEYSDSFNFSEPNEKVAALLERSQTERLSLDDFTGPDWLHLLKPIDDEEESCLWSGKINGKWTGCGDVWQGGLTPDKVVCINNKTYLRCHVDCIKKIYHRENDIQDRPGFCPEVE